MINLMNEWKSDEELYANKCVQILQMLKNNCVNQRSVTPGAIRKNIIQ